MARDQDGQNESYRSKKVPHHWIPQKEERSFYYEPNKTVYLVKVEIAYAELRIRLSSPSRVLLTVLVSLPRISIE